MRKDAFYFQHDSNARNDPKVAMLRVNMGWEGYGIWWAFLEICRENNTGKDRYKIEKKSATRLLCMLLNLDEITANTFIKTALSFELISEDETHIFSKSFIDRMKIIDRNRLSRKENGKRGGRPKKKPTGFDSVKLNESKTKAGKDRKGKDTKEKENKEKDDLTFFDSLSEDLK